MVHKITMENLSHWLKHTISFIPSPFRSRMELVSRSFLCEWSEVWWSESCCPVRREGETSYCVSLKATGATGALKTTGSALLSSGTLISIISSCSGDCDTRLRRQLGYFKTLRRLIAAICIQNRSLSHSSVKCEHADAIHIFLHSVWEISHVSARQVKEEKHHIAIIWQIVLWCMMSRNDHFHIRVFYCRKYSNHDDMTYFWGLSWANMFSFAFLIVFILIVQPWLIKAWFI